MPQMQRVVLLLMQHSYDDIAARGELNAALAVIGMAPRGRLVAISQTPFFIKHTGKRRKGPLFVGIKCEDAVASDNLTLGDTPTKFDFLTMTLVRSHGIFTGYLFELPDGLLTYSVTPNHAHFVRTQREHYSHIDMVFRDTHINVFTAPQGAAMITLADLKLFDSQLIREVKNPK